MKYRCSPLNNFPIRNAYKEVFNDLYGFYLDQSWFRKIQSHENLLIEHKKKSQIVLFLKFIFLNSILILSV